MTALYRKRGALLAAGETRFIPPARRANCLNSMRNTIMQSKDAKFSIGDVVRHRLFPFRGVVFDVDPEFANTEEWYQSIPEAIRPRRDQPFYHLLAENAESFYTAYVSEQNLLPDAENGPVTHPQIPEAFEGFDGTRYVLRPSVDPIN